MDAAFMLFGRDATPVDSPGDGIARRSGPSPLVLL
jgi:hypothetical protein